jgi:tetratricopeptide (TPR) repeat protein
VVGEGDQRPRNLFYLANELKDHGRYAEAATCYEKYLAVSELAWEKYAAYLRLVRCYYQLEQPEKARETSRDALLFDSRRAEAYIQLGVYHYDRQEWEQAAPFFATAATLPRPLQGFVEEEAYLWQPHDFLAICQARMGRYPEAIEASLKALPHNPNRARLIGNLHWLVDQLQNTP